MPDFPDTDSADFDDQDRAEAFDETNFTDGGDLGETRSFAEAADRGSTLEEIPDVYDLTVAIGDRDDDEAVALDATEFDPDALDDADLEEDDELAPRAATARRQDDLDGLGSDDADDETARPRPQDVAGLHIVADADMVEGGEDDVTDYQSDGLADADLDRLGYRDPGVS